MTGWRRTAVWIGVALAGLVLAAGLTTAAAQLSNQRVGLSSEPLTVGDELAPKASPSRTPSPTPTRTAKPRPARTPRARATATPPTQTAAPTVDDHGGNDNSGRGGDNSGGRGRGGGDD